MIDLVGAKLKTGVLLTEDICDVYIAYHIELLLLSGGEDQYTKANRLHRIEIWEYRKKVIRKSEPYKWISDDKVLPNEDQLL
jgi:hypothetical protein